MSLERQSHAELLETALSSIAKYAAARLIASPTTGIISHSVNHSFLAILESINCCRTLHSSSPTR